MTQDEIIEIVREVYGTTATEQETRFAKLVAEAEREACANMVDHILKEGGGTYGDAIRIRGQA
jgi:hypothetical protein